MLQSIYYASIAASLVARVATMLVVVVAIKEGGFSPGRSIVVVVVVFGEKDGASLGRGVDVVVVVVVGGGGVVVVVVVGVVVVDLGIVKAATRRRVFLLRRTSIVFLDVAGVAS